jgi:hypothetical protein
VQRAGRRAQHVPGDLDGQPTAIPAQVKAAARAAGNLNWTNADDGDTTKERW